MEIAGYLHGNLRIENIVVNDDMSVKARNLERARPVSRESSNCDAFEILALLISILVLMSSEGDEIPEWLRQIGQMILIDDDGKPVSGRRVGDFVSYLPKLSEL
jgi:hypothetical protein